MNIKINNALYQATIQGKMQDADWDNRASKSITLTMSYASAIALFVNGLAWSIVSESIQVPVLDANGEETGEFTTQTEEYDNSDYSIAGDITDHRDGTITVKMGKSTELEDALTLLLGGDENV